MNNHEPCLSTTNHILEPGRLVAVKQALAHQLQLLQDNSPGNRSREWHHFPGNRQQTALPFVAIDRKIERKIDTCLHAIFYTETTIWKPFRRRIAVLDKKPAVFATFAHFRPQISKQLYFPATTSATFFKNRSKGCKHGIAN